MLSNVDVPSLSKFLAPSSNLPATKVVRVPPIVNSRGNPLTLSGLGT